MSFLGRWELDDLLTFPANTHTAATGAATDADSVPSYRVYEDETGTAILTGSMAKLDDANTTGFYSEQITLSAANGFEVGKSYTIYISATVASVVGTMSHTFQVEASLATSAAVSTLQTSVNTIDDLLDTEMPALTSALATVDTNVDTLVASITTTEALVDAVWEEALVDHSGTAGSVAEALGAAGSAGDPWTTALPGAYGAGSAGKIIGDNLNATVSSRATQTSVDDLPTNAELATSQAAADDATLAAIAALNNLSAAQVNAEMDTALADYDAPTKAELDAAVAPLATAAALTVVDDFLDTEIGTLITNVAAILADTGTDGVVVAAASKSGYALSSTGLDAIAITAPAGVASNFREMVVQVWRRYFKKSTLTETQLKTYADNGSTVLTTQAVSDDLTTQILDSAT